MTIIKAIEGQKVRIGKQGEKGVTRVLIPCMACTSVTLLHRRRGDAHPYAATVSTITYDGSDYVAWDIADADTAVAGIGEMEVSFYSGSTIAKTVTYSTVVDKAVEDGEISVPTAAATWVQTVTDKTAAATAAAAAATAAKDTAVATVNNKMDCTYRAVSAISNPTENINKLYDTTKTAGNRLVTLTGSYICRRYDVSGVSLVKAEGIQPSYKYPLVVFTDADDTILAKSDDVTIGQGLKTAYESVPSGAVYAYVNGTVNTACSLSTAEKITDINKVVGAMRVIKSVDGIKVKDGDWEFNWIKSGNNSIINFYSAYLGNTRLFQTNTDSIGPYDFKVRQNANGDSEDASKNVASSNTTGGNHPIYDAAYKAWMDGGCEGIQQGKVNTTGKTTAFAVYADGAELTDAAESVCRVAELRWTNRIMAGNTAKLEGEGRYALEEKCYARFCGNGLIEVGVTFRPLEDIDMHWYSGLQYAMQPMAAMLHVHEYSPFEKTTAEIETLSNESVNQYKRVSDICGYGSSASVVMHLDRSYGIAQREHKRDVNANSTKAYLIQFGRDDDVYPVTLAADTVHSWRGYYRFVR